ncbi:MAG: S41 family peptidase [Candidatus Omnitrophica bacterium]|nr:S41 family peptidase [Candidatus Omnitrophota bacterium]
MFKKLPLIVLSTLFALSVTTAVMAADTDKSRDKKDDLYSEIELFSYSLTTIQSDYVDELTPKDLIYGSLKGMLASLDPHSQFLDPEEYTELKTETQGKFGGLGIEISIKDGLLTIVSPIEDTPAWRAGLKSGDRIVKIEGKMTKDITLNDAVKKLRGEPGTDVHITILREKPFEIIEETLKREIIHIQDVKNTQILQDNVGYIRLTEFREDSATEFRKALNQLQTLGANSLVLDLRNNPGGLLNVAIKITEEFIPAGEVIVSTRGRHPSQNTITLSENKNHLIDWPLVVLINEGSASGSEILAGAIKDNKRGILIGTKSFGKGSVQSVIPLPDGSGLRLTTSKYYTPSGASIHEKGIVPDIIVEPMALSKDDKDDTKAKVDELFENVEKQNKEPAKDKEPEGTKKSAADIHAALLADNQVQTAINVLKGIRVYKGFGTDLLNTPATDTTEATEKKIEKTK